MVPNLLQEIDDDWLVEDLSQIKVSSNSSALLNSSHAGHWPLWAALIFMNKKGNEFELVFIPGESLTLTMRSILIFFTFKSF
jgi:hypothetical protein